MVQPAVVDPKASPQMQTSQAVGVALTIALSFLAGVQLYVLSDATDAYFAWTINPPAAAAFFGAGFWAVAGAAALGFRIGQWRQLEPFVPVAAVSTALILVATLLHLDRFHLGSSQPLPFVAAWAWMIVYVAAPTGFTVFWVRAMARGAAGADRVRIRPIPNVLRGGLAAVAAVAAICAVILFLSPGTLTWPWPLTPLTSRMTGAFMWALAMVCGAILQTRDLDRLRAAPITLLLFGALNLVTVVRFSSSINLASAGTLLFMAIFGAAMVLGAGVLAAAARGQVERSPGRRA